MSTVTMRHPKLPFTQTIAVPPLAVPHYRAAGWVPVDEPPVAAPAPEVPTPQDPPAVEDGDIKNPVAPKRRRPQKED